MVIVMRGRITPTGGLSLMGFMICPEPLYVGHHGIMATRNGVIKGYTIDPDVEEHIFQKIEILKPGERLNDLMNERIAYIYYQYDSYEEMVNVVSDMNERIHIDFAD